MTVGRTIKRAGAIAAMTAATLAVGSVTASADGHGEGPPPHGHVMLLHAVWTGSGPTTDIESYAKCVDVAGGNIQPAHHDTIHMGRAGQALRTKAGHLVIPTFSPADGIPDGWTCDDLAGVIPPR